MDSRVGPDVRVDAAHPHGVIDTVLGDDDVRTSRTALITLRATAASGTYSLARLATAAIRSSSCRCCTARLAHTNPPRLPGTGPAP
jgi:hypothetical protein